MNIYVKISELFWVAYIYAKTRKLTGMLLFIDFEKAFDSLEWDFLLMVLKAYNFGLDFVS